MITAEEPGTGARRGISSKRVHRAAAGALLFAAFAPAAVSQSLASVATASEAARRLRADVAALTSDALKGRRSGTAGADAAATYVADSFQRIGLLPGAPRGSYFQTFEFLGGVTPGPKHRLVVEKGESKKSWSASSFLPLPFSAPGDGEGLVVFAGQGIVAPALGRDDYGGVDVRGRVVLVLRGFGGRGTAPSLAPHGTPRAKAEAALAKGAAALLLVGDPKSGSDDLFMVGDAAFSAVALPVLGVKRELAEALFEETGKTLEDVEKAFGEFGTSSAIALRSRVALTADFETRRTRSANVIGVLPGGDTTVNTEIVVIGAHYDHLGLGGPGSRERGPAGIVHPGADDNASGIAGMLELARLFAAKRGQLRRTLLFIAFGAEEEGTLGSLHFLRFPTAPAASIVAMVNLDMVGRLRDDRVEIHGAAASPAFKSALEKANEETRLKLSLKESGGLAPSDHASFFAAGIPALLFFTGMHADYHRASDTGEKVDYEGEARVLRLIANVVASLANARGSARESGTLLVHPPGGRSSSTAMPEVLFVDDAGRLALRVPVNAEISFWRDGEPGSGRVLDLSASLFFVASTTPPPVGTRLEIAFTLPNDFSGRFVMGEALVIGLWPPPRNGFDGRFGQLSDATRSLITEYVRRLAPPTDPSA